MVWGCGKVSQALDSSPDKDHHLGIRLGKLPPVQNKDLEGNSQPVEVPVLEQIELPVNPGKLNTVEW